MTCTGPMAVKHRQASTNLADNVIEPPIRKQKQHMRRSIQQSSSLEACCCLLQFPLIIFKCQVLVICTPRSPPIYICIYICVCVISIPSRNVLVHSFICGWYALRLISYNTHTHIYIYNIYIGGQHTILYFYPPSTTSQHSGACKV